MKLVAKHGYSTGGIPPRGYRNERIATGRTKPSGDIEMRTVWVPDADMAPSVKKAFQMYADGKTLVEIVEATQLVAAKNGLSTLLRNRAYLGERIYNTTRRASLQDKKYKRIKNNPDDFVIVHGTHEAIISEDLFYRVQTLLDQRRPKRTGRQLLSPKNYILSGLLWCKEHDVAYAGNTTGQTCYYACGMRKKLGKSRVSCSWLKKEEAEAFVLNILKTKIFTRKLIREGLEALQKENTKARQIDDTELKETAAQIADIELKLARIWQMVEKGVTAPDTLISQRNKELSNLKVRYAELERQRDQALKIPVVTDAAVADVMLKLQTMIEVTDPKELKAILAHFIERIEISGEKATFNYTFGEAKIENVSVAGDPEGI